MRFDTEFYTGLTSERVQLRIKMSYTSVIPDVIREMLSGLPDAVQDFKTEILSSVCILFLIHLIIKTLESRKKNYPPGPTGLPIVGYLPFLSKIAFLDFMELGKQYGSVFSLKLGSINVVVLHSADAIREAFAKPEIQGRPPGHILSLVSENSAFFVKGNHVWKEQRRFVVQSMKDLGLGKSKIEHEIQDEINGLLDILKSFKGQPLDLKEPLSPSMSNNICALVFGERYDFNDPTRKVLDTNLAIGIENLSQTRFTAFFPAILKNPFFRRFTTFNLVHECVKKINQIFEKEIEKHKKTLDSRNVRDFIDSYLVEMEQRQKKDPDTTFSDAALMANVFDLFSAGSETVRTSILWCMYIVAAYPEVQEKVQREIFEVIGSERSPEYLDQKELPYTHAVILETQRLKTIVPINLPHYTTEDTKVAGYDIPKGTTVLANFWAVHHDPHLWDDPDSFKPERFLNDNGTSIVKPNNYMPFSIGKRSCPGETMAYMELFLYFTSILQKFVVSFPEGFKPTFDAKFSVVYITAPYKVCFIPRS